MQMKVGKIAGMKKGARIMELTYQRNGDYYIPNIKMDEQPAEVLTKYGMMRKTYLQEHKKGLYSGLLLTGRLMSHLLEIQEAAEQRMEEITEQMAADEGVTEELKSKDQMKWIQFMNSIRHSAEEIVLTELIYN
ncbi:TnpV protein [Blautia wexlerae]|uniref:TnpV protein n=1 Tax=Blautia wexlerae TaxID=418240 RepID=UPI002E8E5577|nr:TnpV protein [Blautia wexlerae]